MSPDEIRGVVRAIYLREFKSSEPGTLTVAERVDEPAKPPATEGPAHMGFGIRMNVTGGAFASEDVIKIRKDELRMLVDRGETPEKFSSKIPVDINLGKDVFRLNIVVHEEVGRRIGTPKQFIEDCIEARAPPDPARKEAFKKNLFNKPCQKFKW